ncbi:MAG: PglZ domain-containing protein [Syntrophobacteraceae bacterium]
MKIREFLKGHFKKRLGQSHCLVLYDPDKRYREIAQDMKENGCRVIDGSHSTILAREEAMETWCQLADSSGELQSMVIYLPIPRPKTEVDRQRNPYQPFAIGGAEFPYEDGDSYQALCRKAKPDFEQQVNQLFAAGIPDFETVDAIDSGTNWPKLRSLLKAESAAEILVAILSPTETQQKALEQDEAWPAEFKDFARSTLGLKLKTKSQKWGPIQEELARYVLLSEFVLDLPGELPVELKDVPHAESIYTNLIYKVCETLRTSQPHQNPYMEMANKVASELCLEEHLKHIQDFGKRDTFSFEERTFLLQFIAAAEEGAVERAREIATFRMNSIWAREGERQLLWTISERALELGSMVEDIMPDWKNHAGSLSALFSYYTEKLRVLDMLHRIFEQAVNDMYGELGVLADFIEKVRRRYLKFAEEVQARFVALVEEEGWPPGGQLRQTQVFEKFLAPHLDERRRVALFLVDALRFELAAELLARVAEDDAAELYAVGAQLPTITKVGMAALMPEADGNLHLVRKNGDLVPVIKSAKSRTLRTVLNPSRPSMAIAAS